jgi:hypothetical protein
MSITRAAIMYSNGEVLEGWNYHAIGNLARRLGYTGESIHGFINSEGDFMLPKEAAVVAYDAKQVSQPVTELLPDDLWPVAANY